MTMKEFQEAAEKLAESFQPCLVATEVEARRHGNGERKLCFVAGIYGASDRSHRVTGHSAEECLENLHGKLFPDVANETANRRLELLGEIA